MSKEKREFFGVEPAADETVKRYLEKLPSDKEIAEMNALKEYEFFQKDRKLLEKYGIKLDTFSIDINDKNDIETLKNIQKDARKNPIFFNDKNNKLRKMKRKERFLKAGTVAVGLVLYATSFIPSLYMLDLFKPGPKKEPAPISYVNCNLSGKPRPMTPEELKEQDFEVRFFDELPNEKNFEMDYVGDFDPEVKDDIIKLSYKDFKPMPEGMKRIVKRDIKNWERNIKNKNFRKIVEGNHEQVKIFMLPELFDRKAFRKRYPKWIYPGSLEDVNKEVIRAFKQNSHFSNGIYGVRIKKYYDYGKKGDGHFMCDADIYTNDGEREKVPYKFLFMDGKLRGYWDIEKYPHITYSGSSMNFNPTNNSKVTAGVIRK